MWLLAGAPYAAAVLFFAVVYFFVYPFIVYIRDPKGMWLDYSKYK